MDFREVIALWGTRAKLADEIGVNEKTVHQWALRNDIPADQYRDIIQAARRLADAGNQAAGKVTYDLLYDLGESAKRGRRTAQQAKAQSKKRKPSKGSRAELEPCA